jgi:hypothetical protein
MLKLSRKQSIIADDKTGLNRLRCCASVLLLVSEGGNIKQELDSLRHSSGILCTTVVKFITEVFLLSFSCPLYSGLVHVPYDTS